MVVEDISTFTINTNIYQQSSWEFDSHTRQGVHDIALCDKVCQISVFDWRPRYKWINIEIDINQTYAHDIFLQLNSYLE